MKKKLTYIDLAQENGLNSMKKKLAYIDLAQENGLNSMKKVNI